MIDKIIKEEITKYRRGITEAIGPDFSFKELMGINYFDDIYNYCVKHLGEPIGRGSSRAVFQINDRLVLKVAMSQRGIAQNRAEFSNDDTKYKILPSIHGHDSEFVWIVSDYVVPLADTSNGIHAMYRQANDTLMKLVGETWSTFCTFINTAIMTYIPTISAKTMDERSFLNLVERNWFFAEVYKFMSETKLSTFDIKSVENWGISMREGKPIPVFLDSGFTDEVYKAHYRRND